MLKGADKPLEGKPLDVLIPGTLEPFGFIDRRRRTTTLGTLAHFRHLQLASSDFRHIQLIPGYL